MPTGADLPPLKHARAGYRLGYGALALIALMSLLPAPQLVAGINDKLIHFATYFCLSAGFSILVCRVRSLFLVAVGLIGYGAVIEWLQGLTGYRFMEYQDILANGIGVGVGLLVRYSQVPVVIRRLEQRWLDSV